MKRHRIKLEPSERAILDASAKIFSAFIADGKYDQAHEKELVEKSVNIAIALAERVEVLVVADEELP